MKEARAMMSKCRHVTAIEKAMPEILDTLVGSTAANADSAMDHESMKNIPKLEEVAKWLADRLCRAEKDEDSPYISARAVSTEVIAAAASLTDFYTRRFFTEVYCSHCDESYLRDSDDDAYAFCPHCGAKVGNKVIDEYEDVDE